MSQRYASRVHVLHMLIFATFSPQLLGLQMNSSESASLGGLGQAPSCAASRLNFVPSMETQYDRCPSGRSRIL